MTKHHRHSIRLNHYDYSQPGAYFITICTYSRKCMLGNINSEMAELFSTGNVAKKFWLEIPKHFQNVELNQFIIMPNHIHGIIMIYDHKPVGVQYIEPLRESKYQHIIPGSIGSIIRSYKSAVTRWCNKNNYQNFQWQRNYYERVVRNENELNQIREYIQNNPLKWELDRENPESKNFNLDHDLYWREIYER